MLFAIWIAVLTLAALTFFILDQRRRGRFARFAAYNVDRAWLENLLLPVPAEVAGAAWDDSVGRGEVKAILWRLTREGKIAWDREPFRLRLLADREELHGPDAAVVRALFVTGDAVDRDGLVKYWKARHDLVPNAEYEVSDLPDVFRGRTFDVAAEIEEALKDDAHRFLDGTYGLPREAPSRAIFSDLTPGDDTPAPPERVRDFMSWAYGAMIAYAEVLRNDPSDAVARHRPPIRLSTEVLLFTGLGMHLLAKYLADRVRRKPSLLWTDALLFLAPLLVMPVAALTVVDTTSAARVLLGIFFAGSLINIVLRARSGVAPRHTIVRQDLARARELLRGELARGHLEESWIPYLFAFGLVEAVNVQGVGFDTVAWSDGVGKLIEPFVSRPPAGDD